MPSELRVDNINSTTSPYDPVFSTTGGALSHRNIIINGAHQIAQRATTTAPTPKGANDAGYYITDRWRLASGGNTPARFNLIQADVTDLPGFPKALQIDCTTASASPGADDEVRISQRIEGFNVQQIGKGHSDAKAITISFYVKGTASRTYMVELADNTNGEICQQQFSVTSSWVRHTVTCPARTSGKLANTNGNVMELSFFLHAGSDRTSGTYNANTWKSTVTADRAVGLSGSGAGLMATTSDELYITGFQMEVGSVATPFEHRSRADELQMCYRYFERYTGPNMHGGLYASNAYLASWFFKARKRTRPTISNATGQSGFTANNSSTGDEGGTDSCYFQASSGSLYITTCSASAEL